MGTLNATDYKQPKQVLVDGLLRKLTPDQNAKAVSGWADCSYGSPTPETL